MQSSNKKEDLDYNTSDMTAQNHSSISTTTTPSLKSKKAPNYDWLRPPKPQILNISAKNKSDNVLESSKESEIINTKPLVNKALSTVSSSSSDSSSPVNT